MSPPMTAIAIGMRNSESAPQPIATGNIPQHMATVVMTIGRARLRPASISASMRLSPRSRWATMAYSTRRMEFFVRDAHEHKNADERGDGQRITGENQ